MPDAARPAPTCGEVADRLRALIDGSISREEASEWASHWIAADDPEVDNDRVWRALEGLVSADAPSTDREFLYERIDFQEWLRQLLA